MDVNDYVFCDSQHVTNAKFPLLFFPSLNTISELHLDHYIFYLQLLITTTFDMLNISFYKLIFVLSK